MKQKTRVMAAVLAIALACAIVFLLVPWEVQRNVGETAIQNGDMWPALPVERTAARSAQQPAPRNAVAAAPNSPPPQCRANASAKLLALRKHDAVSDFLDELGAPHDGLQVRLVVDLAGHRREWTPIGRKRSVLGVYAKNRPPHGNRLANTAARKELERKFRVDGMGGVFAAAGGDFSTLQARRGATTVLGGFIRRGIDHVHDAMDAIVPAAFGAHELAITIEEGVALDHFKTLLDGSEMDIGYNLARTAAINARPDILRVILDRGVDPTAPASSVLDDIALLLPSPHQAAFSDVVAQLLGAGDRPFMPSTLAALRRWLPDAAATTLHPRAVHLLASPAIQESSTVLASLVGAWDERIDAARRVENRCAGFVAEASSASDRTGWSLAAKQHYEDELERRTNARLTANQELLDSALAQLQSPEDAGLAEFAETMENMQALCVEGRWREAIALASDWPEAQPHASLLDLALWKGAPLDVIVLLIERNGGLPQDAIMQLTRDPWPGAAGVAEELARRFGLNVAFVDGRGRNAFSNLSERFFSIPLLGGANTAAMEMAEFLADHSVSTAPSPRGLDTLDRVLLQVLDAPFTVRAATSFARFLLDIGAPVERSHRELMIMFADLDPEGYRRLVDAVPELSPTR